MLYAFDWRIFMAAVMQWWQGGNPYGTLVQISLPGGAFAYPPTALTWMCFFLPFGSTSFFVWTIVQMIGWWLLIRRQSRSKLVLLIWSPLLFNLLLGQTTMAIVLILWAATIARCRGFWWGTAVALAMTKPQTALLPTLWLLWHDRRLPQRHLFWLGILTGTVILALPPTLKNPDIWISWLSSLSTRNNLLLLMAPWQGFGLAIFLVATILWFQKNQGNQIAAGWQWWFSAALFPQSSLYSSVVLLPILNPQKNYWTLGGLALAGLLIGPATEITLPIILSGHILAVWLICGGPHAKKRTETS